MPATETAKKPSKTLKTRESRVLLETLMAFKKGDFSVRMPVDLIGVDGKVHQGTFGFV